MPENATYVLKSIVMKGEDFIQTNGKFFEFRKIFLPCDLASKIAYFGPF